MALSKMAANWSLEKVCELIDLWEDKPCLDNTKHKDFADIAAAVEIEGGSVVYFNA